MRTGAAVRRVGLNAQCGCGETRPQALIRKGETVICHACGRAKNGRSAVDDHHVAAEANSSVTIIVPVNDHRADLSVAQHDWPKATLAAIARHFWC